MTLSIAVAGSTKRTLQCIQALENHPQFSISAIITPEPKLVGRKQVLTTNPVHQWAKDSDKHIHLVSKNLNGVKDAVLGAGSTPRPDYLLVVDFGYLVPQWLLEWPTQAPLNIHPSNLPRWRGSSPAQFALLYGDETSAVSVIEMTEQLDQGPVVSQIEFEVDPSWTQDEYYEHSFELVSSELAEIILKHAGGTLQSTPQPQESPTPIAGRLKKEDAFISWQLITAAMKGENTSEQQLTPDNISKLLREAFLSCNDLALLIERATRAFQPWPELWTLVKISGIEKRMKIQEVSVLDNGAEHGANTRHTLQLKTVCIEGKPPTPWSDVHKSIQQ